MSRYDSADLKRLKRASTELKAIEKSLGRRAFRQPALAISREHAETAVARARAFVDEMIWLSEYEGLVGKVVPDAVPIS